MGSSITIGLAFEHKRFKPPAMENMQVAMNWFEELNSPEALAFKARWRDKFSDETYINDMGQNANAAVYLYKKLVEMAGSTELAAVREQIATGQACIDAPEGQICVYPKSQHVSHRMRQISVDAEHKVMVERSWDRIEPYWLGEIGVGGPARARAEAVAGDRDGDRAQAQPPAPPRAQGRDVARGNLGDR
jgi:branched-chain amino acid transport system substrate-binding protein